jgi:hypothetical protein
MQLPPTLSQVFGDGPYVLGLVHVEFEDGRFGLAEALGGTAGEAHRPPEASKGDLGSLLLGETRRGEGDGTPVQNARHQHLLALQKPRHLSSSKAR